MDYDADGDLDLLCGEYDGTVHLFLNTGSMTDPRLTSTGYIQVAGHDLDIGQYSTPAVTDWNGDDLWDLLVGGGEGTIGLFINDGSPSSPHFSRTDLVKEGDSPLWVDGSAAPAMADLDRDGLPDLVVGEAAQKIRFYRNQGTPGNPVFSGYRTIKSNGEAIDFFSYSIPIITDWNEDGAFDLVVGHEESVLTLFLSGEDHVLAPDLEVTFLGPEFLEPTGGIVEFEVDLSNPHARRVTFDFYMSVEIDDLAGSQNFLGPLVNHENLSLGPGRHVSTLLSPMIPGDASPGFYDCTVYIGDSSEWEFTRFASFSFVKLW